MLTWTWTDLAAPGPLGENGMGKATGESGTSYLIRRFPKKRGRVLKRPEYQLVHHGGPRGGVTMCGGDKDLDVVKRTAEDVEKATLAAEKTTREQRAKNILPTLNSALSPAALCRSNGWGVGTLLRGEERGVYTTIEITAVGRESILAVTAGTNIESTWTLTWRAWEEVPKAEAEAMKAKGAAA